MNKDTDIQFLINEYNDLKNNTKIEEEFKEAKTKLIGEIVKCSNMDFDKCKDMLEDNPEIIIGLAKNIPTIEQVANTYLSNLKQYNNYADKFIEVIAEIEAILWRITGRKHASCVPAFHKYDELFIDILKYINKLEKDKNKE